MQEQNFGPVRFIPGQSQGRYPFCNSIYIEGAKILIDPASDRERLLRLRDQEGVAAVWLSHWHEDHITDLEGKARNGFRIPSDPELENQINDRISFKKFLGLPMDKPSPDHSTFSRFRGRMSTTSRRELATRSTSARSIKARN